MTATAYAYHDASVTLREALPDDCELVWEWNFATDVRARSKTPQPVTFVQHATWYLARLADPGAPLWIIEEGRSHVGVVRIDKVERVDRSAGEVGRISIALALRARGRGIGRRAITAACAAWNRPIVAEILADNTASRACFEACDFHHSRERNGLVTYHWTPERR